MLKTAGHVKKYYKACCTIFDVFNNRKGDNVTFEAYLAEIEKWASKISDHEERDVFRGDMLEVLAEMFFGAFANDPAVGLARYTPVPLPEDYGIDGIGTNAAGIVCAVQIKYRDDPTNLVTYAEIARTFTSAVLQKDLPLYEGSNNIFIFTSAYDVTVACKTVMKDKIHLLNREVIKDKIDYNISFWKYAFDEVYIVFFGE